MLLRHNDLFLHVFSCRKRIHSHVYIGYDIPWLNDILSNNMGLHVHHVTFPDVVAIAGLRGHGGRRGADGIQQGSYLQVGVY